MLDFFIIEDFGFEKEEVKIIDSHFTFTLEYYDWELIELLEEGQLEGEDIEDSENHLKLPTGRIAYFPDDLLRKELHEQIDKCSKMWSNSIKLSISKCYQRIETPFCRIE